MRFLLRLLSMVALVLAVIAGTVDSIQSVSASAVVLTTFGGAWQDLSAGTLALAQASVEHYIHPDAWDPGCVWVLAQPAFAVFLVLALLFWMAGYKREPVAGRFAA